MSVTSLRIIDRNSGPVRPAGDFVLYWMIAARRPVRNFGLERAVEHARELQKPLVVLEALGCGHAFACDRTHRFVLDGMRHNRAAFAKKAVLYHAYVERRRGEGRGLVAALARHACVVVTDEFPCFELPRFVERAAEASPVRLEAIDSNGLLPLRAAPKAFARAVDLRRFLQRELAPHLERLPRRDPLARVELPKLAELPRAITKRWPDASDALLAGDAAVLSALPIDHEVGIVERTGGTRTAERELACFLDQRLDRYPEDGRHPDRHGTSGLSPWLHFGQLAAAEVFARLMKREGWTPDALGEERKGKREGWWGVSAPAEALLDQLVTWRELGLNTCWNREHPERYETLPNWAQESLAAHERDPRPERYSLAQLERADTADEIWNAAQRELRATGIIHNYMRMLWGKKVLEWSPSPREAHARLFHLNDRWALDGRNPNSISGISWIFGRHDRPFGPERPIYGMIRYMSSDNTRKKLRLREYLERFGDAGRQRELFESGSSR